VEAVNDKLRELTDIELEAVTGGGCGGDIVKGALTGAVLGAFGGGWGVLLGAVVGGLWGAVHCSS